MKCKNPICNNEAKGNGKYCSATCKTIYNRNKRNTKSVTKETVTPAVTPVTPTVTPKETVTPVTPLKAADADRIRPGSIPLPGDADYEGVCEKVDGKWEVKPIPESSSPSMAADKFRLIKSKLAGGVAQPTGLPTEDTASLTAIELRNAVSSYTGQDWIASSEYAELCLRLVTWTKTKLIESGHSVPAWKDTL